MARGNGRRPRGTKGGQGKETKKAVSPFEESAPHPVAPEAQSPAVPEADAHVDPDMEAASAPEVQAPMAPQAPVVDASSVVEGRVRQLQPIFRNAKPSTFSEVLQLGNQKVVFRPPLIIIEDIRSILARMKSINSQAGPFRAVQAAPSLEQAIPGPSTRSNANRLGVVLTPAMAKFTGKMTMKLGEYFRKLKEVTSRSTSANDNSWIPVFINDITTGGDNDNVGLSVDDVTEWIRTLPNVFTPNIIRRLRFHCEQLVHSKAQTAGTCATGIETAGTDDDHLNDVSRISYSSSSSDSEEDEEPQSSSRKKPKTS